jgi:hypothetical protein
MEWWFQTGLKLEAWANDAFECHGRFVARRSYEVTALVILLTICCAMGFFNFQSESERTKIWIPQNSRGLRDRNFIEDQFGVDRATHLLFSATEDIKNLLNLNVVEQIWDLHEIVCKDVEADGLTLHNINDCHRVFGIPLFFQNNRTIYNLQVKNTQDLQTAISAKTLWNGQEVIREVLFGNYEVDPNTDEITSFEGTLITYMNEGGLWTESWELNFIEKMKMDTGPINLENLMLEDMMLQVI